VSTHQISWEPTTVIAENASTARAARRPSAVAVAIPLEKRPLLSLKDVAAALQVVLATRRAARNEDHAYWYTVARGM
jgi:hypothetical protein